MQTPSDASRYFGKKLVEIFPKPQKHLPGFGETRLEKNIPGGEGGGVLDIINDIINRMTIDPRIPTMPGRSTSGFLPTRQALLAPNATRNVRCWASRTKGRLHLLRRTAREADFLTQG